MKSGAKRYTVQAYCTGMGWANTRYSAEDWVVAYAMEKELRADDAAWMPGERSTRIVWSEERMNKVELVSVMIHTDSSAFVERGTANEVARILSELVSMLESKAYLTDTALYDANGKLVGAFHVKRGE